MKNKIEFIGKTLLIDNSVLVFGDLHLGYEGSLHESGILVKADLYKQIVEDLDKLFSYITNKKITEKINGKFMVGADRSDKLIDNNYNNKLSNEAIKKVGRIKGKKEINEIGDKLIDKVIILGDLKHEFGSILREEWKEVLGLLDYLKEKCEEIVIIKGNHDIFTEFIIKKKNLKIADFYLWKEFAFLHGDKDFPRGKIYDEKIKYWIIGHRHPAIALEEKRGTKKEKYKCFLVGKFKRRQVVIVPSFFNLQEGSDPRDFDLELAWNFDLNKFRVKIVDDDLNVLDFGELGML